MECFRLSFFSVFPNAVKPSIITQPKSAAPEEGDIVKLYCNATGSPILHISWTFDGSVITANENSRISLSNDSQELTITNVNRGDSGDYRCLVKNRVGNDTSDPSVINVLCKYRISLLFLVMKSYYNRAIPNLKDLTFLALSIRYRPTSGREKCS